MEVYPVSERVNNPTMDDEGLIQPLKGLWYLKKYQMD
jgi:hypothetical protein